MRKCHGLGVSAFSTATTGLITGIIDSWISGKDFVGGLADGVKSGCIGMFTGGLIGGFFDTQEYMNGRWTWLSSLILILIIIKVKMTSSMLI